MSPSPVQIPRAAWATAVRRDQSPSRARTPILQVNKKFGVVKIAPLANWTRTQIWQYILDNDLEYNVLHDLGYPSVGCTPCTRPVGAQDDIRAGRWAGSAKTECGLHL